MQPAPAAETTLASARDVERRSSAVTLSDMEVFIFPELMYSLVLANIMSPRLWGWRADPWFDGWDRLKPYRRILRLRQYIMDHYAFNLDLDTWGLTSKEREMARFRDYVSPEALAQSNALFGYEGDRYYFDIDIRTHFGLDKYEGDVIPYWKTETVEAMDAFRFKPGYDAGAGECVSLAALYAAALFVVAGLPLKDIYLMATPLHSQDFLDVGEGILTNNRRLVTKTMWFNGTALSAQARRALENERVTVVAHESGWIHVLYPQATIDVSAYRHFASKLRGFLRVPLSPQILGNFVRHYSQLQSCLQVRRRHLGSDRYIAVEKLLAYEQGSPYRFNDETRERLMGEVGEEDFEPQPLPGRLVLDDLEDYVRREHVDIRKADDFARLKEQFGSSCASAGEAIEGLRRFCLVEPRLPDAATKTFVASPTPLSLDPAMSREQIIARLQAIRPDNELADLAFYAYRDLNHTDPVPFVKAALERSPVSLAACRDLDDEAAVAAVRALADGSIYDEPGRLAQPDEVWNFGRGDGAEKAVLLANLLRARHPQWPMSLDLTPDSATLRAGGSTFPFASGKALLRQTWNLPTSL